MNQSLMVKDQGSPIVPRPHGQTFKVAGEELPETAEPRKRLYVLSDDSQSLKPLYTHFTRVDSAIAFRRSLGISLNLNDSPRIHSFAWNVATRCNPGPPGPSARFKVFDHVCLRDAEILFKTYFTTVHPIFGVIDRESFARQAVGCWTSQEVGTCFVSVLGGVIALGSLFSTDGRFTYQSEVVEQGRLALDSSFAHHKVLLSVDLVAGWILRAIYLRATDKPHLSWMASNMAMHIADSVGLHQEMSDLKTTARRPRITREAEAEIRQRVFWVAASLNRLFACHYGRESRCRMLDVAIPLPGKVT